MKRQEVIALLLVGTMLSGIVAATATEAGSAVDPLIALDWLKDTFLPNTVAEAGNHAEEHLDQLLSSEMTGLDLRVKRADVLWLESGSTLTPLAGALSIATAQGAVIDTTKGEELPSDGGETIVNHRYLAAENTQAAFSVTSDTAVVRLVGPYDLSPSDATDYNALAGALKQLGLFKGSDVPYGNNYELETAPTRIQGLIMFLRLMGEEPYALAYPGSGITFADVPDWAEAYVAYAYDKGYTKGQEIDDQWRVVFGTQDPLAPRDYLTFLLRALDYSEERDFQWLTAVEDAQSLGLLTDGEVAELSDKPFLRSQVVYLSYYALSAQTATGETLLERLTTAGAIGATNVDAIMKGLEKHRL